MGKFSLPAKAEKTYLLSEESATAEVVRILDFYRIDIDAKEEKVAKVLTEQAQKLVEAFREGKLEVKQGDKFEVVQKLSSAQTLTYSQLSGKNKRQTDKVPRGEDIGKAWALIGSLTNVGVDGVDLLTGEDLQIAEALGFLFLNS